MVKSEMICPLCGNIVEADDVTGEVLCVEHREEAEAMAEKIGIKSAKYLNTTIVGERATRHNLVGEQSRPITINLL